MSIKQVRTISQRVAELGQQAKYQHIFVLERTRKLMPGCPDVPLRREFKVKIDICGDDVESQSWACAYIFNDNTFEWARVHHLEVCDIASISNANCKLLQPCHFSADEEELTRVVIELIQ